MRAVRYTAARVDCEGGKWTLVLTLDAETLSAARAACDDVNSAKQPFTAELKEYRKPRSLDANAYAWTLIDKIAAAMRVDKLEVYREAIRSIGGVSDIVCVRETAVENLVEIWQSRGAGFMADVSESKLKGCRNVTLYYGSSVYDAAQMSALIDHIVQDAENLGIDTRTPLEIAEMEAEWHASADKNV